MGDAAEDFRLLRLESKRSRAVKREYGPKRLTEEGIPFDSHNDGAHLILYRQGHAIDYWPGTGRWNIRGGAKRFGLEALVKHVKGE